nr:MAG TPA: hypothetical protein [Caudoviricetes sp.]
MGAFICPRLKSSPHIPISPSTPNGIVEVFFR